MDKVWVYGAERALTTNEKSFIENNASAFLGKWESHGSKVPGSITVKDDFFVVVKAGDCGGDMCGRAQDAQVNLIKELDAALEVGFMNRLKLHYKDEQGTVHCVPSMEIKSLKEKSSIGNDTMVYNLMVSNEREFQEIFEIPLSESWASNF